MKLNLSLISAFALLISATLSFAEEKEPEPTPLPRKGSLASSFSGGPNAGTSPESWASDVLDQKPAPLSGSVSRSGAKWIAKVFNNSKDSFSASVKMTQLNERGGTARNDYFSVSLKPGESSEREYSIANGAINANLELSGWKKLGGNKPAEAVTTSSAAPVVKK